MSGRLRALRSGEVRAGDEWRRGNNIERINDDFVRDNFHFLRLTPTAFLLE